LVGFQEFAVKLLLAACCLRFCVVLSPIIIMAVGCESDVRVQMQEVCYFLVCSSKRKGPPLRFHACESLSNPATLREDPFRVPLIGEHACVQDYRPPTLKHDLKGPRGPLKGPRGPLKGPRGL